MNTLHQYMLVEVALLSIKQILNIFDLDLRKPGPETFVVIGTS